MIEAGDLELVVPSTHCITLLSPSEAYCPQLSGFILVPIAPSRSDRGEYPDIRLTLTQGFTAQTRSMTTAEKKIRFLQRISMRRSMSHPPHATGEPENRTDVETVADCRLRETPAILENHQQFHFAIAIPPALPGTMKTTFGGISYAINAIVTWPSGTSATTMRPIDILRRVIPGPCHSISHIRNYHGAKLFTALRLTPSISTDSKTTKLVYAASLVARRTITPGDRPMETKYVVIKKFRWWVEETVRLMKVHTAADGQEGTTTCVKQCVRQVCSGKQRGRWTASKPGTEDRIEIPLDITIPTSARSVDSLDMSSYSIGTGPVPPSYDSHHQHTRSVTKWAITVSHQLKLDIITGQDTYNRESGNLLDRRHLWKSFKAFYPLSLHEVTSREDLPEGLLHANPVLPQYEDRSAMPPDYDILLRYSGS
ncbi:hypothetical protein BDV23DRAFT_179596 [Aspergillus alliaceus]|uniref:Arrestin-like N-terminal domain-containing protein n=1 Tax=Petromyces alliaceus TaxID=209559 RepID=A0A5N7CJQ1_PETAA|nr:hypothetical protein BDV23DRAFT_179596 [Aspergillus alliaceus]